MFHTVTFCNIAIPLSFQNNCTELEWINFHLQSVLSFTTTLTLSLRDAEKLLEQARVQNLLDLE